MDVIIFKFREKKNSTLQHRTQFCLLSLSWNSDYMNFACIILISKITDGTWKRQVDELQKQSDLQMTVQSAYLPRG